VSGTDRAAEPSVEASGGGAGRRRRWTPAQKGEVVRETLEPGASVFLVALRHGIHPSQLSRWRKLYREGKLTAVASEPALPASAELASAIARIRDLERLLGRKTLENGILREAVELARERRWWTEWLPSQPGDEL